MKALLVSLVSDQTLPDVQLIKEFSGDITDSIFITTEAMERKGTRRWIEDVIHVNALSPIIVDEFSVNDITTKLSEFDFSHYDKVIVNLTGGTKIMTLAAYDFFKEKDATIYYVTGIENDYIQLFPGKRKLKKSLNSTITLEEYLMSYGFEIRPTQASGISFEQTEQIFQKYTKGVFKNHRKTLRFLRTRRNNGVKANDFDKVSYFLECIDFKTENNSLSSQQVKYLTGEWFEEYIGERIKRELQLRESDIMIGAIIRKDIAYSKEMNPTKELLGIDAAVELSPENEIDVMFMWRSKFHIIECKTSIIDSREEIKPQKSAKGKLMLGEKGNTIQTKTKSINILGDTIYKSDALKTKFGLFAKSYIFTLTDFKEYISKDNNKTSQMIGLLNRASSSRVKVVDKEQLMNEKQIKSLL